MTTEETWGQKMHKTKRGKGSSKIGNTIKQGKDKQRKRTKKRKRSKSSQNFPSITLEIEE